MRVLLLSVSLVSVLRAIAIVLLARLALDTAAVLFILHFLLLPSAQTISASVIVV